MRKPIIAGNWKLNKTVAEAVEFTNGLKAELKNMNKACLPEIVIAPVFTALYSVSELLDCDYIKLSSQNCYYEPSGAFTGEVGIPMLKELNCKYIIIGHSERRQYFSETDEMINKKAKAILAEGIIPIICCGESLEQRENNLTDSHITSQIKKALDGISSEDVAKSVIAYEPIWAIGTGKTCDANEANRVIGMIRNVVKDMFGVSCADQIRILYGESVKPETIEEQMSKSDIDGALVGGASLKADSFVKIVTGAMTARV